MLKPYVKKQNVISFIDDLLAPYANAWLILNRPTDANLPDDIVAMLVSLADYQTTDWKPVAMWALVRLHPQPRQRQRTSVLHTRKYRERNHERARRTPQLHDIDRLHDVLAALERVTGVDSLNRQSPLARRTRAASAIETSTKGHTLQQIRGSSSPTRTDVPLAHLRGELQTSPP